MHPLFLLKLEALFSYPNKFSYFGAESASCFACEKSIAITHERKRGGNEKKETGSYPCQSDPAWRLSSPLIALLISCPLSVDLGQQSSSAGADWRLSSSMSCLTLPFSSPWPLRLTVAGIQQGDIWARDIGSCSEMTQEWLKRNFFLCGRLSFLHSILFWEVK